jgi:acyl-CoA thioester hydrolase
MSTVDEPHDAAVHTLRFTVEEADIDRLGHASNIAYVRWLQDASVAHSAAVGFGLEDYRRLGGVFVVRRHEIDYLRPVLRGDRLEVRTWIGSAAAARCVRITEIRLADAVVARAETTFAYVEDASGRPMRIPEPIRSAFRMPARAALADRA